MGRKRKSRLDLPERVYYHHGAYYFVHADGRWEKLDRDYAKAMARWAELLGSPEECITVSDLLDRYVREVIPNKAPRTQKDNLNEIRFLRAFFGEMDLQEVTPSHIANYRDNRTAKTRANREIALLSHAFARGCEWGFLTNNPCREVKRNREKPRDRYITDEELEKFKEMCPSWLKTYISLKVMLGLRQQDLLALRWDCVTETHLLVTPIKTSTRKAVRLKFVRTPELNSLLASLPKSKTYFFSTKDDTPYSASGFASTWQRLMVRFVSNGNTRFREHDIRGKVATDINDPVEAQRLLGHSSVTMTEAYIKQRSTDEVVPRSKK